MGRQPALADSRARYVDAKRRRRTQTPWRSWSGDLQQRCSLIQPARVDSREAPAMQRMVELDRTS